MRTSTHPRGRQANDRLWNVEKAYQKACGRKGRELRQRMIVSSRRGPVETIEMRHSVSSSMKRM